MRKVLGVAAAAAIALTASVLSAEEVKGPIQNINRTNNTFQVGDKIFTASPTNTVGLKLSELQDGDNVRVQFSVPGGSRTGKPINAMKLERQ